MGGPTFDTEGNDVVTANPRKRMLTTYLTPREYIALEKRAAAAKVSLSEYTRHALQVRIALDIAREHNANIIGQEEKAVGTVTCNGVCPCTEDARKDG